MYHGKDPHLLLVALTILLTTSPLAETSCCNCVWSKTTWLGFSEWL